jgi:hypothetical protein
VALAQAAAPRHAARQRLTPPDYALEAYAMVVGPASAGSEPHRNVEGTHQAWDELLAPTTEMACAILQIITRLWKGDNYANH